MGHHDTETAALASVMRPVEEARGLANHHYVDPDTFERERDLVFGKGWAALAFDHDVPEPAHAAPIDFLGQPLLLVRDRDNEIRVFANVCRHRGMILVREPGPLRGMIRCPYHSWVYDLDGRLRATPHVGGPGRNADPAIDRDLLGLVEVRAHIWAGIVFVDLSGTAPCFEQENADLLERWRDFEQPSHFAGPDSAFDLDVACNWKLAVENYCESYHLPWVHPGLNAYSRLEDHYNIVHRDWSGQGTRVYAPDLSKGRVFADFADLPKGRWDSQAEYVALFPNVLLGVHRDHRFAVILVPQGPERTVERVQIRYADRETCGEDRAEARLRNMAMWREIFEEDIFVVEGMQRGRHAPRFDGGRFSPAMDEPTHAFHAWVARRFAGDA